MKNSIQQKLLNRKTTFYFKNAASQGIVFSTLNTTTTVGATTTTTQTATITTTHF